MMADEIQEQSALFSLSGVGVAETGAQTGRLGRVNAAFCELRQAISEVMTDTTWLSRRILDQLARLKTSKEVLREMYLSRREPQVLERVALGMTNDAIGRELGLVSQTVRTYITYRLRQARHAFTGRGHRLGARYRRLALGRSF